MVALRISVLCLFSFVPERNGANHLLRFVGNFLRLVRSRGFREEVLNVLKSARSLCAALLLKIIHPVRHGANHLARCFLRRFYGVLGLFARLFLTIALLALDNFDRGFLSHADLYFLSVLLPLLSLFNVFRHSEFNYYSLERLCAVFLANARPQSLEPELKSACPLQIPV